MPAERVAILGAGNMGRAMAKRLAERGFGLVVYNRTADRARELAAATGAAVAETPAQAAAQADVLITMVADDAALAELCEGPAGVLDGVGEGTVTVQASTVLPDTARHLGEAFAGRGMGFLDAPVSGSVTTAEAGELTFMVGGEAAHLERARPVLEALSKRIFHLGPVGSGAAVKLAVNDIVLALDVALAEALVLAEAAGVERAAAYDVFAAGAAGAPFVQYKRQAFVDPGSVPPAFSFDLAQKDLSLILALAERTGTPMTQAEATQSVMRDAAAALGGDRDFSEVATHIRSLRQ